MKKFYIILVLITPLFCYSQFAESQIDLQLPQQTFVKTQPNDFFVLDSMINIAFPSNVTLSANYYDYYSEGNLKAHILYGYFGNVIKVLKKYEYDYDDEDRITSLVEYDPNSDTTLIPSEKTTTIWFDNDFISERIVYSYNGTNWNLVTRKLSPDLGQSDSFTTFNFSWNSNGANWDTVSKTISYLNGANKVFEIYYYHEIQGEWQITKLITKEYTDYDELLLKEEFLSTNNGGSYILDSYIEYGYTTDSLLTSRFNRWDLEYGWNYHDVWLWDDYGRLYKYSYYTFTPLHPEIQGGIVYKYYYNEQGVIHHRNVFSSYNQNQIANDFYYYSDFTVNMDLIKADQLTCFPNPFSTSTTIEYTLQQPSTVQITFYNHLGEQVDVIRQQQTSGTHKVVWDASRFKSGIYFYRLQAGAQTAAGKLIILR